VIFLLPIELTPALVKAMDEYEKKFGDDFPAEYVGGDTAERLSRIKECLATNTPVPESEYADMIEMV
jgi:hypothetical protein